MRAELVLATLLETARLGDSGPATVAAKARRRVDTPGGGQIPGDTPWRPGDYSVKQLRDCGIVVAIRRLMSTASHDSGKSTSMKPLPADN